MATDPSDIPHGMRRVYRRFARWRSAHPGVRLPIPGRLWKAAADVAREHGICRTAQVLRLEYGKTEAPGGIGECGGESASNEDPSGQVHCARAAVHGTGRVADGWSVGVSDRVGRTAGQDAHPVERDHGS